MSDVNPWNVLIYMSADNNLSEDAVYALTEIYRLEFDSRLNVVAQLDSNVSGLEPKRYFFGKKSQPAIQPIGANAKKPRKLLNKLSILEDESFPPKINNANRKKAKEGNNASESESVDFENFADHRVLKHFIETSSLPEGARNFLVLSGHGDGPTGDFMTDRNPPASLKLSKLKEVLDDLGFAHRKKGKLDILGLDSCLMSMAEICYELSENVQYLVGSEGFVLEGGWPYYQILEEFNQGFNRSTKDLACLIVEKYAQFYKEYTLAGISTDHSVSDLSGKKVSKLVKGVKALTTSLLQGLDDALILDAIIVAHWRAQSYKFEQHTDLWDFCSCLTLACSRLKKSKAKLDIEVKTLSLIHI